MKKEFTITIEAEDKKINISDEFEIVDSDSLPDAIKKAIHYLDSKYTEYNLINIHFMESREVGK